MEHTIMDIVMEVDIFGEDAKCDFLKRIQIAKCLIFHKFISLFTADILNFIYVWI